MNDWTQTDFDAIVVGTGPGGATVARELSKRGKKVLVLERGSGKPIQGTILQFFSFGVIPGRSLFITPQFLALFRAIIYGGSSIAAYASAFDPPYEMFDKYGIDLRPEVAEAKKELPIAPLADELVGPAARRIMESALELGYDWQKLPKIVYQDKCRRDCDKCTLGCPYGAKWTARVFIEQALDNHAILLTGAQVKGVVRNNQTAEAVIFEHKGKKHRATAPAIIISSGGIGTPNILRNSGIKNAGYDFFFDPLIVANGTVGDLNGGREFPMVAGIHFREDEYILTDLVWPGLIYGILTSEVLRLDRLSSHSRTLPIMIKARDSLGGRLTDRGWVNKRLGESDKKKLLHGYGRAKKILENAGARNIFKTWYVATHPGGTAKINDVVDSDLKTELDHLYVCDCSVIPEAWGLPPTLTIISLGKRLAKHLSGNRVQANWSGDLSKEE
ncbi:MAG: glucose-methanol-choline oxidoreductase [Chloroflexi bacterium RBG_16_54_18]|nr:MAG: glucose-methanol-choline oxidoreductase [Chloroflexi bacterium RBG_16_54_18]